MLCAILCAMLCAILCVICVSLHHRAYGVKKQIQNTFQPKYYCDDMTSQTRLQNTQLRKRASRTRAAVPDRLSTDFKSDAEKRRQERFDESDLRKKDRILNVLEHKTVSIIAPNRAQ